MPDEVKSMQSLLHNRKIHTCDRVFSQSSVESTPVPIPLELFKDLVNVFERWAADKGLNVPVERRKLVWHIGWEYVEE